MMFAITLLKPTNSLPLIFPRQFSTMGPVKRGTLIVLEGCDRSGKSSQASKLHQHLNRVGRQCILMRFPDRTTLIGTLIDNYLRQKSQLDDRVIHHLFSANRWEFANSIRKQLNEGINIIIDRYAYSGAAFSAAKKGMDLEWCKQVDVGLPRPDLVLFLDIEPKRAAERSGFGDERYENLNFQNKVYANYLKLKEDNWTVVNADREVEEIHVDLSGIVVKSIEMMKNSLIGGLWVNK